jgi:hypothetical protein
MSVSHRGKRTWLSVAGMVALACVALGAQSTHGTPPRQDEAGTASPNTAAQFRLLQRQDENGYVPPDGLMRAKKHVDRMRIAQAATPSAARPSAAGLSAAGIVPSSWTWLGPGNIGGRVRSIVVNPVFPSAWFAGSVSGGIWKTIDNGAHWEPVDDFLANLSISTMVIQPGNPLVMYAGTGELFTGLHGAGIFKSTDGGNTWAQLASTATVEAFTYVNRLAMSPDGAVLLAATWRGIYRSIDGGVSFDPVLNLDNPDFGYPTTDVAFNPADNSKAIAAAIDGRAWYTTNGGLTWADASGLAVVPGAVPAKLAYAPGNPGIVYASIALSEGSIYKSTDGGVTYSLVSSGTPYWETVNSEYVYDNAIWVDPADANTVIVGGRWLYRSTDGGVTLSPIYENVSSDKHAIVAVAGYDGTTNRQVLVGSDRGVHIINDISAAPADWVSKNNNLGITQFYGAAGNASSGTIFGGTQDNGALRYTPAGGPQAYTQMDGDRDNGYAASDPMDPDYFYGEGPLLSLYRSSDGGISPSGFFGSAIPDSRYNSNFIAPFILDPNNPNTLLAGGKSLWRTTDAKFGNPPNFFSIKGPAEGGPYGATLYGDAVYPINFISAIAIAPGNSDLCWVGHNNGDAYKATDCTAVWPTWTRVDNNGAGLPNRMLTRLTIDPLDPSGNRVYATFGGFSADNVWRTTDGGLSWSSVSGSLAASLPAVPLHDLEIHPSNSNWLYAATEIGIFTSEDAGATWQVPQGGPANVIVSELFWMGSDLVAATFGRGLYRTTVAAPFPSVSLSTTSISFGDQSLGTTSGAQTVTLTNTGTAPLSIAAVVVHAEFPLLGNSCHAGASVPVGGSCALSIGFSPGAEGIRTGDITIYDDAGDSPQAIHLTGLATPHADVTPPTVTVLRPTLAGERLFTGTPVTIRWNAADEVAIATIDVFVSTNGGTVYTAVAGCSGLPGTARECTWASPGPVTTRGRIRVVATDAAGNSGVDASDANFSIVNGHGVITVSRPNTALTWAIGTIQQLKWTHNLGTNTSVNIEVSRDNGATWALVAASVASSTGSSGLLPWHVTGPATTQGRIRVSALNSPVSDISNVPFTIAAPLITVTQPNGNVLWTMGSSQTIRWTHNIGRDAPVSIELSRDGGTTWEILAPSMPNSAATSGTFSWLVTGPPTIRGRVRVNGLNGSASDVANVDFRITAPVAKSVALAPLPGPPYMIPAATRP